MKTIIFFDVDNTIYSNQDNVIPNQTKRLLSELAAKPDVLLGLATGRGTGKLHIINDVLPLFTYRVLVNGAVVFKNDQLVFEQPIAKADIEQILIMTQDKGFNIGMVGLNEEAVNYWDERVSYGMELLRGTSPVVDPHFHLKHKVYQIWLFTEDEDDINTISSQLPRFKAYPWHKAGVDFLYGDMNKAFGIRQALAHEQDYRLICIGDGANDIQMIEMADIGIAMGNSRFAELKEKADHLAPHVRDDQLYDFFKQLRLL